MTNLQMIQVLKILFPAILEVSGYTLTVDGSGNATIDTWDTANGTQPTTDELNSTLLSIELEAAQQTQVAVLQAASDLAQSSFTSSALGTVYTYPSAPTDQANLTACVTYSLFPSNSSTWTCLFYCASSAGVAGFVSHTAAQIQQVGQDAMTSIMAQKSKLATLEGQVAAATSVSAVHQIIWQ